MKKNFIWIATFFLVASGVAVAQLPPPPLAPGLQQWFNGWYVNQQGDTIAGHIYLSNQIDNQNEFKYSKTVQHNDEIILHAGMARSFLVKDRLYESIVMELDRITASRFLRCVDNGNLRLYVYCELPANGVVNDGWYTRQIMPNDEKYHEVQWIIRKGSDAPVILPAGKKFIDLMTQYVGDYQQMSLKIGQKEKGYRSGDIVAIVGEYNKWKKGNP